MVDQQTKNGSFNGSFLVLNLGTNTLEVGNSFAHPCPSESFQQKLAGATPNHPNPKNINNAIDTISSSTEEGSFSTSETSRTKRCSEEEEDPDWVPEKKARKSSSSANITIKPNEGPSVDSNPPQVSVGGFNGMHNLSSGPPPMHLMSLLGIFGWKVVFQPGKGEYVYISPNGLPYFSLPKAFETFLQGTSKYSEKAISLSRVLENNPLGGSLVQTAAASSSFVCGGNGNAAEGSRKKRRGRRKKNSNVDENNKPIEISEEQLQLKDDPLIDSGEKSVQITETVECQEANQASSSCKVDEKTKCHVEDRNLGNKFNLASSSNRLVSWGSLCRGKFSGVRTSGRRSRRHILADNEMNAISGSSVCGDKLKDKEQNTPPPSEGTLKQRPDDLKTDNGMNNKVRSSDCSTMAITSSCQSGRRSAAKGRRSAGLRRSGRFNMKNEVSDRDQGREKQDESNFSAGTRSATRIDAGKIEGKPFVPDDVLNEKTDYSTSAESLLGETKRSNCSSMFFSSESNAMDRHGCHETSGIRRSMRINGKHVPVDDDSDIEIGFDDGFLYSSKFGCDVMAKKDKEKPVMSSLEVDSCEGGNAPSDDLLKWMKMDTSCCQMSTLDESYASLNERSMELAVPDKCSPSYTADGTLAGGGKFNRKKKKTRRGGCGLTVRRNGKDDHQEEILTHAKINVLSCLIDCGTLNENERVYYITANGTRNTPGFVTRRGVWCNCCKELVPLSKFVAHAGGTLHLPWDNIFLLSGKTLLLCLKEAWEKEKVQRKIEFRTVGVGDPDPSDDTCGICADGGHLICCDSCPSTFHQTCLMLKTLPEGSWYCPYCICTFCMATVRESDNLLSCIQCGHKYHKSCAWRNNSDLMGSVPFSFCGKNCQKVATALSDMLGITNHIEDGFSWTLLKHFDEDSRIISNQRLSFIMESNIKLSMALSVLDECFVPLIDQRTGVDMICQAIYNNGSNFNRLNYERFYTVILERDEEIISAASLRLHGKSLAEMPFIGTRSLYRRQGMCRRLLKAVEDILCSLHVEKLIIPAIPDLLETWTNSFSFKPLKPAHREEIKNLSLMVFAGTTLLQKSIHGTSAVVQEDVVPPDDGANCIKNMQESKEVQKTSVDQINTKNHFINGTHAQEGREVQKSFSNQINTISHFGSGNNMEDSDVHKSCRDQINTRSCLGDIGSSNGKNTHGSHELQRSFSNQINTRSGNIIQASNKQEQPFGEQINIRNTLADNGFSYDNNIQDIHELHGSFDHQRNPMDHFGSGSNIQESHEPQRSFDNQMHIRNHLVDSGISNAKSIHDIQELRRSFGYQINTGTHVGTRNNIHESQEVHRSFAHQRGNNCHLGFQKNIQEGNGLLRCHNDPINNTNNFGSAPDLWIYECILKGQTDSALELCRNIKDSNTTDSLALSYPNLCNGSISETTTSQQTSTISTVPHNLTAANLAHATSAKLLPNISSGSISNALPFQSAFVTNGCSVPSNLTASAAPDSLAVMPPNISKGSMSEVTRLQQTVVTNIDTVSHNLPASISPDSFTMMHPNIPNGSISDASSFEHVARSNNSMVPRNPATASASFPDPSIDAVLYTDHLSAGTTVAPDSQVNSMPQVADELRSLQMDAVRSSISFDNLLRAVS